MRRFAVILSFVLGLCAVAAAGVWVYSPADVSPAQEVSSPAEVALALGPALPQEVSSAQTTRTTGVPESSAADESQPAMYRSERYRDAHGVNIRWPRTYDALTYTPNEHDNCAFYQSLEFAKATHWDEFLALCAQ